MTNNVIIFDLVVDTLNVNAFESMWTLMLGLNASLDEFEAIGESLDTFDYTKSRMARILYNNIIDLTFRGVLVSICV